MFFIKHIRLNLMGFHFSSKPQFTSFLHSLAFFTIDLLGTYYTPATVPGTADTAENKTDRIRAFAEEEQTKNSNQK